MVRRSDAWRFGHTKVVDYRQWLPNTTHMPANNGAAKPATSEAPTMNTTDLKISGAEFSSTEVTFTAVTPAGRAWCEARAIAGCVGFTVRKSDAGRYFADLDARALTYCNVPA